MIRKSIFFEEDTVSFFKGRNGKFAEHVRWAMENYIHNIRQEEVKLKASASSSRKVSA